MLTRTLATLVRLGLVGGSVGLGGSAISSHAAEQLQRQASAFLRSNADSAVNWLPWGEAAWARAKTEQKPVFLAIGVFTSELSRAMTRQTFANRETAEWLNQNFVCVLVDREERPEVAAQFQAYVAQAKQLMGWPLNLWLTPELLPFDGASYLPPTEEWGKPGFMKFALQVQRAWATDPAACRSRAAETAASLTASVSHPATNAVGLEGEALQKKLTIAAEGWRQQFDAEQGGFGEPPKNPEPELLRFLLRRSPVDREAALTTLRKIAGSALRDPLDGGFFHAAIDVAWNLPQPQKILSDQARLALAFLEGAAASPRDEESFDSAARGALDYALTRLVLPDGTFAAAEDATGEEFAGYYAWTRAEIDAALGKDAPAFAATHGVENAGNVSADADASGQLTGKNLLRSSAATVRKGEGSAEERLRAIRDRRPAPPRDDRATAGAHGWLLAALARAGTQLHEPRFQAAAARLFEMLQKEFVLSSDGDLRRQRGSIVPAAPTDYAAVALGCRELAQAAKRADAESFATKLLSRATAVFFDQAVARIFATPATRSTGIFFRPPALREGLSAESLWLLAGCPPAQRRALLSTLSLRLDETNAPATGDDLLALTSPP